MRVYRRSRKVDHPSCLTSYRVLKRSKAITAVLHFVSISPEVGFKIKRYLYDIKVAHFEAPQVFKKGWHSFFFTILCKSKNLFKFVYSMSVSHTHFSRKRLGILGRNLVEVCRLWNPTHAVKNIISRRVKGDHHTSHRACKILFPEYTRLRCGGTWKRKVWIEFEFDIGCKVGE